MALREIEGSGQEFDFRYPGPKPQTREAALVMLADVVEAASRTLENPTPARIKALREHVAQEKLAVQREDVPSRTELQGDFHVRMAELMGNRVLAELLSELISRCALITLMYQSTHAAEHSNDEHADIVKALAAKDEELAVRLMNEHLMHVEENLTFDRKLPTNDLSLPLT